jgi:hypothetical protein
VTFLDGVETAQPVFDRVAGRVTGFMLRRPNPNTEVWLAADLIVDATGKRSRSPRSLEEWGFRQQVNVGYATRIFEHRPGDFFNSSGGVVSGTPPRDTRYAAVLAAEGNRWVVTLSLMSPNIAWGVLARPAPRGTGSPWSAMRSEAGVLA